MMQNIDIALCCDDNYAPHLGVALCSVLHNLSPDSRASVHIVHNGVQRRNKKNLEELLDKYATRGTFIEIHPERLGGLVISRHITPAAYIRIALADLLPSSVSKVLYLDCDLIAREDITPLATADIGPYALGAIPEGDQYSWSMNELKHHARIQHDAPYFNSGVLLLDLDRWRAGRISEKVFQLIRQESDRIRLHDQDALNIFFCRNYQQLDCRWNYTVQHLERPELYGSRPVSIAHFITGVKPWHAGCDHPMRAEYFRYLAHTPWGASGPIPHNKSSKTLPARAAGVFMPAWRKILSIRAAHRAIRSRTVFCPDEIKSLRTKFAVKSMFINAGMVKASRETLLGCSFKYGSYEYFVKMFDEVFIESRFYFEALSTKPCIIDCSSGIGMAVLYFKRLYPYSTVIAFEPDEALFAILKDNILSNGLEDVRLVNSAAAGRDGALKPPVSGQPAVAASGAEACVRLSQYIEGSVDFLKLDCEDSADAVIEELAQSGKLGYVKKIHIVYRHKRANGLSGILGALDRFCFGYKLQANYEGFCTEKSGNTQLVTILAYALPDK